MYIEISNRDKYLPTKFEAKNIIWVNSNGQSGDVTVKLRKFNFEMHHVKFPKNSYRLQQLMMKRIVNLSKLNDIYIHRIVCRSRGKHKLSIDVLAYL